ncbi:hypothetical protein AA313_de0203312 [Arthrobotrys entomopaga]|nr:hypothetical protein AA313_de0203312 [Arthrobotrys entomopaga]
MSQRASPKDRTVSSKDAPAIASPSFVSNSGAIVKPPSTSNANSEFDEYDAAVPSTSANSKSLNATLTNPIPSSPAHRVRFSMPRSSTEIRGRSAGQEGLDDSRGSTAPITTRNKIRTESKLEDIAPARQGHRPSELRPRDLTVITTKGSISGSTPRKYDRDNKNQEDPQRSKPEGLTKVPPSQPLTESGGSRPRPRLRRKNSSQDSYHRPGEADTYNYSNPAAEQEIGFYYNPPPPKTPPPPPHVAIGPLKSKPGSGSASEFHNPSNSDFDAASPTATAHQSADTSSSGVSTPAKAATTIGTTLAIVAGAATILAAAAFQGGKKKKKQKTSDESSNEGAPTHASDGKANANRTSKQTRLAPAATSIQDEKSRSQRLFGPRLGNLGRVMQDTTDIREVKIPSVTDAFDSASSSDFLFDSDSDSRSSSNSEKAKNNGGQNKNSEIGQSVVGISLYHLSADHRDGNTAEDLTYERKSHEKIGIGSTLRYSEYKGPSLAYSSDASVDSTRETSGSGHRPRRRKIKRASSWESFMSLDSAFAFGNSDEGNDADSEQQLRKRKSIDSNLAFGLNSPAGSRRESTTIEREDDDDYGSDGRRGSSSDIRRRLRKQESIDSDLAFGLGSESISRRSAYTSSLQPQIIAGREYADPYYSEVPKHGFHPPRNKFKAARTSYPAGGEVIRFNAAAGAVTYRDSNRPLSETVIAAPCHRPISNEQRMADYEGQYTIMYNHPARNAAGNRKATRSIEQVDLKRKERLNQDLMESLRKEGEVPGRPSWRQTIEEDERRTLSTDEELAAQETLEQENGGREQEEQPPHEEEQARLAEQAEQDEPSELEYAPSTSTSQASKPRIHFTDEAELAAEVVQRHPNNEEKASLEFEAEEQEIPQYQEYHSHLDRRPPKISVSSLENQSEHSEESLPQESERQRLAVALADQQKLGDRDEAEQKSVQASRIFAETRPRHRNMNEQEASITIATTFTATTVDNTTATTTSAATSATSAAATSAPDFDDAKTVYSDASSATTWAKENYISELADVLFQEVRTDQFDILERISTVLPELLKAFALKLGYNAPSQTHRDIMFFVHKNRSEIAKHFTEKCSREEAECLPDAQITDTNKMTLSEKMDFWHERSECNPLSHQIPLIEEARNEEDEEGDRADVIQPLTYRDYIFKAPAFEWLIGSLRREVLLLTPIEQNYMETIRDDIIRSLPKSGKISKSRSAEAFNVSFKTGWKPLAFINEQAYETGPGEAIEKAITLTGSAEDAQALTCAQYIYQTWPSTSKYFTRLIKDVLQGESRVSYTYTLPDSTKLTAYLEESSELVVEALGTKDSVAEIGQQLAWLCTALSSSPHDIGVVTCIPSIKNTHTSDPLEAKLATSPFNPWTPVHMSSGLPTTFYRLNFTVEEREENPILSNGQCWHNMFKNPVVVKGYPIPRRSIHSTGLEIPLNMMAGLAQTQYIQTFNEQLFIKGFSTLLVPTRLDGDMLIWHLVYKPDGSRISYLENNVPHAQGLSVSDLEKTRHFLGWCSKAKYYAGKKIGYTK